VNEDAFELGKEPFSPLCFNCPVPARACRSWDAHEGEVNSLVWNLAGRMLVTGGGDKRIRMWNIARGS
jgi:autophagy-related protein 16